MMFVQWQIHWSRFVPPWLLVLGLVAVLAWVVFFYVLENKKVASQDALGQSRMRRVVGLTVIRLGVLGLLIVLWVDPTIERTRMGKPALALLVDRSASMNHIDPLQVIPEQNGQQMLQPARQTDPSTMRSTGSNRFARVVQYLLAGQLSCLQRLEESYHVELVVFDEQFRRLEPTGTQSLNERLRDLRPADALSLDEGNSDPRHPAATRLGDVIDFALQRMPDAGIPRAGPMGGGPMGASPAVIVLLSDGVGTRGETLAATAVHARRQGVPIYTVAVGSEQPLADVALGRPVAAETLFLGDSLSVETVIRAVALSGQSAEVILRDTASGQILDQTTIELPPMGEGKQVRLQTRPPEAGKLSLEMQIKLLPTAPQPNHTSPFVSAETNLENNRQLLTVQVHDDPIRVLLVQSGPSYEFRALKQMLQRDPALKASVWLQQADRQFATVDAAALSHFPLAEQELLAYDVVIWGDVDPELIPPSFWPRLFHWVNEQGGGLALLAGPRYMPRAYRANSELNVLLPIRTYEGAGRVGAYALKPTVEGIRDLALQLGSTPAASQAVWNQLPSFSWIWETAQLKPGAQRLVEVDSLTAADRWPVVVRQFVGAGEVLMHLTDESWRMRYRTDNHIFARYWGQAVRRLARGKLVDRASGLWLKTDAQVYQLGTAVHVRAQFHDTTQAPAEGPLVLQWESSAQTGQSLELQRRRDRRGLFEATLRQLPVGVHQLHWLPTLVKADNLAEHPEEHPDRYPSERSSLKPQATVRFKVNAPPWELARLAVDRQTLLAAARETHGKAYTLQSAVHLPEELPPAQPVPWEHYPPYRLASTHTVIGLLVGLLATEWILRRRGGLL
jgi:hypothetical protein